MSRESPALPDVARIAEELLGAGGDSAGEPLPGGRRHLLPSRDVVERVVYHLREALFPGFFGAPASSRDALREAVERSLGMALGALEEQVRRGLLFDCTHAGIGCRCARRASLVRDEFARRLPSIRALLETDVRAAYEGDPAATSPEEALFCYPGVTAITHHRLAHELHRLGVPLIARLVAELAHSATGIDIHPGASIGGSFFIDHGTGVVIGETCVIGERVRLYQGVTLGARRFPTDQQGRPIKGIPRHPIVEDDVTIYAGATILGRVTIGRGSRIGGNVWLTTSVPEASHIRQAQHRSDSFEGGSGI